MAERIDEGFQARVKKFLKARKEFEEQEAARERDTYTLLVEVKEVWLKEGRAGLERWLREREEIAAKKEQQGDS